MLAIRVIMVWLYNDTGRSVFAVALYYAAANVSTKTIFPGGSYHADRIISVMLVVVAGVVVLVWGARTLASDGRCGWDRDSQSRADYQR
jgi:hypothetical protein